MVLTVHFSHQDLPDPAVLTVHFSRRDLRALWITGKLQHSGGVSSILLNSFAYALILNNVGSSPYTRVQGPLLKWGASLEPEVTQSYPRLSRRGHQLK